MNTEYMFWNIIPRKETYVYYKTGRITFSLITITNKISTKIAAK